MALFRRRARGRDEPEYFTVTHTLVMPDAAAADGALREALGQFPHAGQVRQPRKSETDWHVFIECGEQTGGDRADPPCTQALRSIAEQFGGHYQGWSF